MPHTVEPRRIDSASRTIDAPAQLVFQAFVQPASLMAWLPPQGMSGRAIEYDFREGGRYRIELRYEQDAGAGKTTGQTDITQGRFLELIAGRRITQSVEFESDDPSFAGEMMMAWSFEPVSKGTLVTIVATNVPSGISKADHDAGLRSSLDQLAAFVERRH